MIEGVGGSIDDAEVGFGFDDDSCGERVACFGINVDKLLSEECAGDGDGVAEVEGARKRRGDLSGEGGHEREAVLGGVGVFEVEFEVGRADVRPEAHVGMGSEPAAMNARLMVMKVQR